MLNNIYGCVRYEDIQLIAEGGMGAVYKAKMKGVEGFEKIVAIKTMLDSNSESEDSISDFINEAKLVANLIHENIVQIYQLDKSDFGFYFVLEYVDGLSLFDLIDFNSKIKRLIPVNLAVFIASRIARGLAYAHSRKAPSGKPLNIVHCDICPRNILINTEGVPKITDFGIARFATKQQDTKRMSGKLGFMSPEQATFSPIDYRSDIFSLGVVLFQMLTGQKLRNTKMETKKILASIRNNEIDYSMLPAEVPEDLRAILRKMLQTYPEDRYSDTSILAKELEYFIYKDGYGPTIVTLAKYMHDLMPGKFTKNVDIVNVDKTVII